MLHATYDMLHVYKGYLKWMTDEKRQRAGDGGERHNSTKKEIPETQNNCSSDKTRARIPLRQEHEWEPRPIPYYLCTGTPGDGKWTGRGKTMAVECRHVASVQALTLPPKRFWLRKLFCVLPFLDLKFDEGRASVYLQTWWVS